MWTEVPKTTKSGRIYKSRQTYQVPVSCKRQDTPTQDLVENLPDSNIGSTVSPFLTWSDSPVRELSSTFRSLLWITTPSAGNKSPEINKNRTNQNMSQTKDTCLLKATYANF